MKFKKFIKESIEDMDKRCPECNTLLNDGGTCPKCADGEEDYGDEMNEACNDYQVKKYGSYWFGILGPDKLMLRDSTGKLRLFRKKDLAKDYIDTHCSKESLVEMTNSEKLKAAFPELNFDEPIQEEVKCEELSNLEKLKKAYPELNFDNNLVENAKEDKLVIDDTIVENTSDTVHVVRDVMTEIAKDDKKARANTGASEETAVQESIEEELTNIEKLKRAYPELDLDESVETEEDSTVVEEDIDEYSKYDDDYSFDDVEEDRIHAALYGGDRTYCQNCGSRLHRNEWGGYCPECDGEPELDDNI